MKEIIKKFGNKLLSVFGGVLLALPILFLENSVMAGMFSVGGLAVLIASGIAYKNKSDLSVNALLFFLGYCIRLSTLFGSNFIYTLGISAFVVPYAFGYFIAVILTRKLNKTKFAVLSIFVLPLYFSLAAFLLAVINFGFISNLMGYLMMIPIFTKCLLYVGEYGLTFFLMLGIMCFITLITKVSKTERFVSGGMIAVLLCVSVLPTLTMDSGTPDYYINVALATSQEMDFLGEDNTHYSREEQVEMFGRALDDAVSDGADLLILNEEYFAIYYEDRDCLLSEISALVEEHDIPVLACVEMVKTDDLWINEAVYFDSDGEIRYEYVKNNLVPFVEIGYYVDGEERVANLATVLNGHEINLSFIICADINDNNYVRKTPKETELLIVPAWDWDTLNIEQLRTSIVSASVNTTLLKHSFEGFSFVSNPDGTVDTLLDFRRQYETVKTVRVPIWEKQ